jgi:hypothetical protein
VKSALRANNGLPSLPDIVKGTIGVAKVEIVSGSSFKTKEAEYVLDEGEYNIIRIVEGLSSARRWHRFFHELLHHIEEGFSFSINENDDEDTSSIYDKIASGLLHTFLVNGWKLPGEK